MEEITMTEQIPRPEHPRPDFQRDNWLNLNGKWAFDFDPDSVGEDEKWYSKGAHNYSKNIIVPFPWESELSEVKDTEYKGVAWYQRKISVPEDWSDKRPALERSEGVVLKFGAVDWEAKVWVNDNFVGQHEGGYSAFEFDITDFMKFDGEDILTIRAYDVTHPEIPSGKQTGWYTPTSGIWQTVYLEAREDTYVEQIHITPDLTNSSAHFQFDLFARESGSYDLLIESDLPAAMCGGLTPAPTAQAGEDFSKNTSVQLQPGSNRINVSVEIPDPKLWTPDQPHLYNVTVMLSQNDKTLDKVNTYFGMREVSRGRYGDNPYEYILLNGKPMYLMGALNQSFNPQGIYTYPSDEYIKNDMLKTKEFGFNFLRLHIKVDEPRYLYWADVVGVMLMCDMPNFTHYTEQSKRNWEMTLRDAIDRDFNHPSIISWCDFNETWGIGHGGYNEEHQAWVEQMYCLTKELDATRLVEENSPCRYDHVATDINSWHFYIDDYEKTKSHIENVVENTYPGSSFNYVEGRSQGTEPLINSEYGAVSAGGGDRDISWGFKYQTNLMRRHEKIVGYIYTELMDIEWEHNGFMNYDRSVKEFGYDEMSPFPLSPFFFQKNPDFPTQKKETPTPPPERMSPGFSYRDLNNLDFLVIDAPPCPRYQPGESVKIPVYVSHFSEKQAGKLTLKWRLDAVDVYGESRTRLSGESPANWTQYRVAQLPNIAFILPEEPFLGTLTAWLEDEAGQRLAANYINLDVCSQKMPRAEIIDAQTCVLRFKPNEFQSKTWEKVEPVHEDKVYGHGVGQVEYHLAIPEGIDVSAIRSLDLTIEMAAKADDEKIDWPSRRKPVDYPQTDDRKYPTDVTVSVNGIEVETITLPDDPANSCGVFSHNAAFHHGSYGYLTTIHVDFVGRGVIRDILTADRKLVVQFAVKPDAQNKGGLAIFGARLGRYPLDPTIRLYARGNIGLKQGWYYSESIAV